MKTTIIAEEQNKNKKKKDHRRRCNLSGRLMRVISFTRCMTSLMMTATLRWF
jgi:hypothetical protein